MVPAQVVRWIRQTYPKPVVNTEWLDACCAWIADEMHLNPATESEAFIAEVENQLLESDLRDSMEPGTGLPRNAPAMNNQRIRVTPGILVEVTAITEIGHSAFNLHNVRQARIERADLAGLAQEEGVEDDEDPIPNYPRSMLRFELSDGTVTMPAIEYRSLPGLKLNETPLGFKILLKDVPVRRGTIFLEPKGIVLKGHKNSDRDKFRDRDFLHGLLGRMMKPIPADEQQEEQGENSDENNPPPGQPPPLAPTQTRAPLREILELPEPQEDRMDMDDDADAELPRKRRIPNLNTPATSSSAPSSSSTLVASRFFAGSSAAEAEAESSTSRLSRVLSPVRGDPIDITDSSMEDPSSTMPQLHSLVSGSSHSTAMLRPSSNNEGGNKCVTRAKISYEEFEFDDEDEELDAAFLDEVAKAEQEVLLKAKHESASSSRSSARTWVQPRVTAESQKERRSNTPAAVPSRSTNMTHATHPIQTTRPTQPQARVQSQPQLQAKPVGRLQDVITIDDGEDEDDKENVPVPKRRVRRRVSAVPEVVIDISD